MDGYITKLFDEKLVGIPLRAWQRFLALFTENQTTGEVLRGLDLLARRIAIAGPSADAQERLREKLLEIGDIIADDT